MKRWLLLLLLCLLPFYLAGADPFLTIQGPIMEKTETERSIVVNEMTIFVEPSTPITGEGGQTLEFDHLNPGQWVSVEVEPDEFSGMVANRIVLTRKK